MKEVKFQFSTDGKSSTLNDFSEINNGLEDIGTTAKMSKNKIKRSPKTAITFQIVLMI